jgi:hypothetical protein
VPSVISPERFEEFSPGLTAELLQLIQATAEMEMADVQSFYGPTGDAPAPATPPAPAGATKAPAAKK